MCGLSMAPVTLKLKTTFAVRILCDYHITREIACINYDMITCQSERM